MAQKFHDMAGYLLAVVLGLVLLAYLRYGKVLQRPSLGGSVTILDGLTDGEETQLAPSRFATTENPKILRIWIHRSFDDYLRKLKREQPDVAHLKDFAPPIKTRFQVQTTEQQDGAIRVSKILATMITILPGRSDLDRNGKMVLGGEKGWKTVLVPKSN